VSLQPPARSEGAHRPASLYAFTSREPVVF
jgi:hypothetical protein